MENMTTKDFCHDFRACADGTRFALKFDTMKDCYAALLDGEAGPNSAEWAIWTITRPGVMSDRDLRLFAVKCARRVRHLMKDERSIEALDVAERYANGEAADEELDAASVSARYATCAVAYAATRGAAGTTTWTIAWAAERRKQLKILAEFGNPFEN